MHKLLKLMVLLALGLLAGLDFGAFAVPATPQKGVIRVKLQPEMAVQVGSKPRMRANGIVQTGAKPLDRAVQAVKGVSIRPMLPYSEKFAAQRHKYGLDRWYVVTFDENVPVEQALKVFKGTAGVERSEKITPMSLQEGRDGFRVLSKSQYRTAVSDRTLPFNDPMLGRQWHYQNFGDIPYSVAGADINLFNAWKSVTGSSDVIVAVIDGGIDYTHEDLAPNVCINLAELNGTPGVDDDGNGYVDDVYGWNFCTNEAKIYPHSHGTHVAGTVAAVNNNGIGVSGVAGGDGSANSGVKMISCQVFDSRSGSGEGDFAAALAYAAERGAVIAQCSWGWDAAGYYEQAVLDAIDYFTETARSDKMTGGLCIFAMGNTGETGDFYPGSYDKVIGVTAMTSELTPASYSTNGPKADIVAPGGLMDYGEAQGVLSTLPGNTYGFNEGTSMATPHVSGVAALVLSKYGSSTFTNEILRTQLLTSVNDFYGYGNNSRVEGLFGSGYLDATKAVSMNREGAPEPVSEFSLQAAQDYISVSWVIPSSPDNNVNSHIIYYSNNPFTAADDLTKLNSKVVDTKFMNSGENVSFDIEGLDNLTEYYIAIQAVSRWGTASALSAVKSISTNAGPKLGVSDTFLSMVSTADAPKASATFSITNEAEGLLKWQAGKRTVSAQLQSLVRPNPGTPGRLNGKIAGNVIKPMAAVGASIDYDAADYPAEIKYYDTNWAMIGETDRSIPNALAQWFRVDPTQYPDGFNLTSLWFEGSGLGGENPRIAIYRGNSGISQASLITDVEYNFFAYNFGIALPEQIWFAPGESFWVVARFDSGQENYPLPMARSLSGSHTANYSYMSTDDGATWVQLSEALKGSMYEEDATEYVWGVRARSLNPDWSSMVELLPSKGTVAPGESQKVTAGVDGTKLVNGNYQFNILLTSNETGSPVTKVSTSLNVTGNAPDVIVPKVVDFGNILTGTSKTVSVEVYNQGFGSFRGSEWGAGIYADNISVSSDNFVGPEGISSGFPARAKTTFELTFAPKAAGSHSGTVTFTDSEGRQVKILVQGSATDPAKLTVEPAVLDAGTLTASDESRELTFAVRNDGKYPLEFVFPKFSDQTVEGATRLHKFGYTISSTIEGFNPMEYTAPAELISATDIASKFSDDVYVSPAINLGFSFPYYGKKYDRVYITSFGGVMFAMNEDPFRNPLTEHQYGVPGTGLISAYGNQLQMGPSSKVEYAKQNGKFVVSFKDVLAVVYDSDYAPVSFRIILSPNGDIEMYYDDYEAMNFFQEGANLFCGINDPEVKDCLTLTSAEISDYWGSQTPTPDNTRFRLFGTGTAVLFSAPQAQFISALTPANGLLSPGESVEVRAKVEMNDNLVAGETFNAFTIVSNDPAPEVSSVRFNANVSPEGLSAAASVSESSVDFGEAYRTSTLVIPVAVANTGRDVLTIASASVTGGMTVSNQFPADIKPGAQLDVLVNVPTDNEGAVSGVLTIATSAGDLTVNISGTVIGCPDVELSFDAISETLESGTPLSKVLIVSNNGNETLKYAFTGDENVRISVPEKADTEISYTYVASADGGATFAWEDIETNGLGTLNTFRYYNQHDYVAVDLPFEFPFYGKKYSKMYIYNTGFISFTERHDDRIWPEPPAEFPQGSVYTNMIAPYWGLHSMNTTKTAGTYHYVTEDRAVVSFMEYGNSMNMGVCFQVILEKDGSFKFQYKAYDEYSELMGSFGLAGISNEDGSEGMRLPDRYIAFDNAVVFSPARLVSLAPGQKDQVTIDVNTNRMAGQYDSQIALATNIPSRENISIPVSLTLTGESRPVIPEGVTVTNVLGYRSTDYTNPIVQMGACYDASFKVANEGTAKFTVMSVSYESPMIYDEWFDMYSPAFMLMANLPELDWITGEPTGRMQWQQVDPNFFTPVEVGNEPLEFSVPMMESEYWMTPGEINIPVTIVYGKDMFDEDPKTAVVNVKFIVTPAPAMILDKEEIRITGASDNLVSVETLSLANYGEYKLDYTISLDPTGAGEEIEDIGGGIAPAFSVKPSLSGEPVSVNAKKLTPKANEEVYNVPNDFEYTNALYYDAMPGSTAVYNYGANSEVDVFKASVQYKAPAAGFNISHIYMPIAIESARNVTVNVDIVEGNDPEDAAVIGHGSVHIERQSGNGQFFVIPLDRPVYMNPGEEFCVVVTYPEGIKYPAYLCVKEEPVTAGRYLGWTEATGWFDIAQFFEDQYGSLGYVISALETTPGEPWVKLIDTPAEGSVAPQAANEVKIQISAASARLDKGNKAMLVLHTNDPMQPLVNFPIYLDKNGAPVIGVPASRVYAKEGETTLVDFNVSDADGDEVTVEIDDVLGLARLAVPDDAEGLTLNSDGTLTVAPSAEPVRFHVDLTPEYGDHGSYWFTLNAFDSSNHKISQIVAYEIERVNRAPQTLDVEAIVVEEGQISAPFVFSQLFTEPDGQAMTYLFKMADQSVAQAFISDNSVVFYGIKEGNANATVTATDDEGASAEATLPVVVKKASGVEGVTADGSESMVRLLENPVSDTIRLLSGITSDASVEIFSNNGAKVLSQSVSLVDGNITSVNIASVPAGFYLLRVTAADRPATTLRLLVL